MTKVWDLFDEPLFRQMLAEGFVRRQEHPTEPLSILNYTPRAQYGREWNPVTRQCRGLIYEHGSWEVVARPFPKFFNLGELADDEIPQEPFEVFEKMDGSLGVLYWPGAEWRPSIATRGSFTSDQAQYATKLYRQRYDEGQGWLPVPGMTYLFEIVYPENRIVVDYGDLRDLVLLDVIDNATGESLGVDFSSGEFRAWPGPRVKAYDYQTIAELLEAPQPENAEGYVIRFVGGMRVKVKHDEYVRLHRIVTGVSTKTVWQYLRDGRPMDELLERVPDEFFDWLTAETRKLRDAYAVVERAAKQDYERVTGRHAVAELKGDPRAYRKAFAQWASIEARYPDILFRMLDGKNYSEAIWKRLEPAYEKPFAQQTEDVA